MPIGAASCVWVVRLRYERFVLCVYDTQWKEFFTTAKATANGHVSTAPTASHLDWDPDAVERPECLSNVLLRLQRSHQLALPSELDHDGLPTFCLCVTGLRRGVGMGSS